MSTDPQALIRLLTWLSPAFPVGAFGYSHGLEQAIRDGAVRDAASLEDWLATLVELGSAWTDAVLLAAAWRGETQAAELAAALAPSQERLRETVAQGEAFLTAVRAWSEPPLAGPIAYPVAVGAVAAAHGIALEPALIAYLHAFSASLTGAALRAIPLGQSDGVRVAAALEPLILATAARAAAASLDDLGSAAILSDIAAMRHETLEGRLFVS
jgi:urease accessory protein